MLAVFPSRDLIPVAILVDVNIYYNLFCKKVFNYCLTTDIVKMCVVEGDGEYQSDEEDDAGYSGKIVWSFS
jgi:hypothetical protein